MAKLESEGLITLYSIEFPEFTPEDIESIEKHHKNSVEFRERLKYKVEFGNDLLNSTPTTSAKISIGNEDFQGKNIINLKIDGSFYPVEDKKMSIDLTLSIEEADAIAHHLLFLCKKYMNK